MVNGWEKLLKVTLQNVAKTLRELLTPRQRSMRAFAHPIGAGITDKAPFRIMDVEAVIRAGLVSE